MYMNIRCGLITFSTLHLFPVFTLLPYASIFRYISTYKKITYMITKRRLIKFSASLKLPYLSRFYLPICYNLALWKNNIHGYYTQANEVLHPSAHLPSLPRFPGDPSASTIAQGVRCLAAAATYLYFHDLVGKSERNPTVMFRRVHYEYYAALYGLREVCSHIHTCVRMSVEYYVFHVRFTVLVFDIKAVMTK